MFGSLRTWSSFVFLLIVLGAFLAPLPTPPEAAAGDASERPVLDFTDSRPNVVLMLVDDMAMTDLQYMPKVRRLIDRRGVFFKNAISPNPVCCPARAAIITGQQTHNNGVFANKGYWGAIKALREPDNTLPKWLQDAGYSTAFFGKYLNGYGEQRDDPPPAGWDFWDATSKYVYGYTRFEVSNNGDPLMFEDDYITTRQRQRSDDIIRDFAARRNSDGSPFFIFDSYVAPHGAISADPAVVDEVGVGAIPEEKYRNLYADERNPAESKPSWNKPIRNYPVTGRMRGVKPRDREHMQQLFLNRIRSLASVDDAVAQTVRVLKEVGEYDNTILIFVSDNGYILGEHGKYGKEVALEESLHIPLLMAGPGIAKNETSKRWATLADLSATILEAAEATPGRPQDGRSLLNASAEDGKPRTALAIENGNNLDRDGTGPRWHYQGVLLGTRYTYTKWSHMGNGEELYDNKRDPYQLVNVAGKARYRETLRQARKAFRNLKDCAGPKECMGWPVR